MLRTVRPTAGNPADKPRASTRSRSSSRRGRLDVPTVLVQNGYNEAGDKTTKKWLRGKFLGRGGFAECYDLTDCETGEHFAGKVISKESLKKKNAKSKLEMEVRVHRSLHHKHIVGFVSVFETDRFVIIVLELCENKSMMELIRARKRLTEKEARYYLDQTLSAVAFMHEQRVIHRDLKLGNIFLNSDLEVKIGDFGLATQLSFDDERKKTICGTPNYIAPEVLQGGDRGHSYEVDVWSLGVILYTWIIGRPPFETSDVKTTYRRIRDSIYYFPDRVQISEEAKDLVKRMLQKDPAARPTLQQIAQHRFFRNQPIPEKLPTTALVIAPVLDNVRTVSCAPSFVLQRASAAASSSSSLGATASWSKSKTGSSDASSTQMENLAPSNANSMMHKQYDFMRYAPPPNFKSPKSSNRARKAPTQRKDNIVDVIHSILTETLQGNQMDLDYSSEHHGSVPEPAVWLRRWGDYSKKYGLAYQLSNGGFGTYFNDATIMVLAPDAQAVQYVQRAQGRDSKRDFALADYPAELEKKVNLLKYFATYLPQKVNAMGPAEVPRAVPFAHSAASPVYVKKWLKTKHAIFFRLTDNTLQVNYNDNTGIIISSHGNVLTYVDKNNEMSTMWMSQVTAHENRKSLETRLSYIRDMLACLIAKRGSRATAGK